MGLFCNLCKATPTSVRKYRIRHVEIRKMLMLVCSRGAANIIRLYGDRLVNSQMLSVWSQCLKKICSQCWVYIQLGKHQTNHFLAFVRVYLSLACLVHICVQMWTYLKARSTWCMYGTCLWCVMICASCVWRNLCNLSEYVICSFVTSGLPSWQ